VREHQPLLVTGPTGIGKTFVACALGNQAAREGYGVFYTRLRRLLDDPPGWTARWPVSCAVWLAWRC
jgi:MoxR-like ATPase